MKVGKGSAPGKVIIAGEHSVVYGFPAIAVALGLRCAVECSISKPGMTINSSDLQKDCNYSNDDIRKLISGESVHASFDSIALAIAQTMNEVSEPIAVDVRIRSDIPISAGLGSSAAVVVASIASILDLFGKTMTKKQISSIAFEAEKITHGKPSGIDNSIATYGGILKFENGNIEQKELKHSIPLIIGNTNIPRDTKKLVGGVSDLKTELPNLMNPILKTMGDLAQEAIELIEKNDITRLGKLFDINQGLLDSIGVGHNILSEYIWKARDAGALGAKLTGAGGGGCMIALAKDRQSQADIVHKLEASRLNIIATEISQKGVMIGEF